jgi:hypothetical protein
MAELCLFRLRAAGYQKKILSTMKQNGYGDPVDNPLSRKSRDNDISVVTSLIFTSIVTCTT